jgi:hypothetical protein
MQMRPAPRPGIFSIAADQLGRVGARSFVPHGLDAGFGVDGMAGGLGMQVDWKRSGERLRHKTGSRTARSCVWVCRPYVHARRQAEYLRRKRFRAFVRCLPKMETGRGKM